MSWPFLTISGHFSANYIENFHKTEILMNILKCQTCLNHNWIKSYDTKHNFFVSIFFNFVGKNENLQLINYHFTTISGHFTANYTNIFHKTEVQMVILSVTIP